MKEEETPTSSDMFRVRTDTSLQRRLLYDCIHSCVKRGALRRGDDGEEGVKIKANSKRLSVVSKKR